MSAGARSGLSRVAGILLILVLLAMVLLHVVGNLLITSRGTDFLRTMLPAWEVRWQRLTYVVPVQLYVQGLAARGPAGEVAVGKAFAVFNPIGFLVPGVTPVPIVNASDIRVRASTDAVRSPGIPPTDVAAVGRWFRMVPYSLELRRVAVADAAGTALVTLAVFDVRRFNRRMEGGFKGGVPGYRLDGSFTVSDRQRTWQADMRAVPAVPVLNGGGGGVRGSFSGSYDLRRPQKFRVDGSFGERQISLRGAARAYPAAVQGTLSGTLGTGRYTVAAAPGGWHGVFSGSVSARSILGTLLPDELRTAVLSTDASFSGSGSSYTVSLAMAATGYRVVGAFDGGRGFLRVHDDRVGRVLLDVAVSGDPARRSFRAMSVRRTLPFDITVQVRGDSGDWGVAVQGMVPAGDFTGDFHKRGPVSQLAAAVRGRSGKTAVAFRSGVSSGAFSVEHVSPHGGVVETVGEVNYESRSATFQARSAGFMVAGRRIDTHLSGTVIERRTRGRAAQVMQAQVRSVSVDGIPVVSRAQLTVENRDRTLIARVSHPERWLDGWVSWDLESGRIGGSLSSRRHPVSAVGLRAILAAEARITGTISDPEAVVTCRLQRVRRGDAVYVEEAAGWVSCRSRQVSVNAEVSRSGVRGVVDAVWVVGSDSVTVRCSGVELPGRSSVAADLQVRVSSGPAGLRLGLAGVVSDRNGRLVIRDGSYVLPARRRMVLDLQAKNLLAGGLSVFGDIRAEVAPGDATTTRAMLSFRRVWINQYHIVSSTMVVYYDAPGGQLLFTCADPACDAVQVDGTIRFYPGRTWFNNLRVRLALVHVLTADGYIGEKNDRLAIEVKDLSTMVPQHILNLRLPDVSARADARVDVVTRDARRGQYRISAGYVLRDAEIAGARVGTVTGRVNLDGGTVELQENTLRFPNNQTIVMSGRINLAERTLACSLSGTRCDLSILNGLGGVVKRGAGKLALNLTVRGSLDAPEMDGYLQAVNGTIEFSRYLQRLEGVNVTLLFRGNTVRIADARARSDESIIVATGSIRVPSEVNVRVFTIGRNGPGVSIPELALPAGGFGFLQSGGVFPSLGKPTFDVSLTRSPGGRLMVRGIVHLEETQFTWPPVATARSGGWSDARTTDLDLRIMAGRNTRFINRFVEAVIEGGIRIQRTGERGGVLVNGSITSSNGDVYALGTLFKLRQGVVDIRNNAVALELLGEHEIPDPMGGTNVVQLVVDRAPVSEIKPRMVSPTNPNLRTEDIVSILLGLKQLRNEDIWGPGQLTQEQRSENAARLLQQQIIGMLESEYLGPLLRNLLRALGLTDSLQISPRGAGAREERSSDGIRLGPAELLRGIEFGFVRNVDPNWLVRYVFALDGAEEKFSLTHQIEVRYRLTGGMYLKGTYNTDLTTRDERRVDIEIRRPQREDWQE